MSKSGNWFRVRVTDMKTGECKANVKIPASLAGFGMKMAAKSSSDSLEGIDVDEIITSLKNGGEGLLVDVEDEEKGEHIEVFVE